MNETVTHYVCGLLFTDSLESVVLIRKNRPAWQAGKLNGIGGKVEPGESPQQAMVREFREEAGANATGWSQFAKLCGADFQVWFYCAADSGQVMRVKTRTDEPVGLYWSVDDLSRGVPNLGWLVPMAQEHLRAGGRMIATIRCGGTDQAKEGEGLSATS